MTPTRLVSALTSSLTPDRLAELRRRAQTQRPLHWADALELLDLVEALRRECAARTVAEPEPSPHRGT